MSRSDRAFTGLLIGALAVGAVLALPLALTLFPGSIQQALHGSEAVMRTCVAAVYAIGRDLPPLGAVILALALGSTVPTIGRSFRLLQRTDRAARRTAVTPAAALAAAADRTGTRRALRAFEDQTALAYTAGLLRPRIWVSNTLAAELGPQELDAVLWHEREHFVRRDPLRVLIARVIASLFFLVPWIRVRAVRFEVAKELDADRAAVRAQHGPGPLAGALVALGCSSDAADLAIGAWSMSEARVDQLCGEDPATLLPRTSRRVRVRSVAALAIAFLLAFGQAARANVLPASIIELGGAPAVQTTVHECPLPIEGPLF